MRVLQVTSTRQRRGAEVFASELGAQLRRLGHSVHTLALDPSTTDVGLDFERQHHTRGDPRAFARLVSRIRNCDVVAAHGGTTLAVVAAGAAVARRPFVYRNIGDPRYWGSARFADARIGLPLRHAAHVVALYEGAGAFMASRYRLDPGRVTVASNGVAPERFPSASKESRSAARRDLGIDDDARVIGYLGALSAEKRPEWALRTAALLDRTELIVAGGGALRDQLERSAEAERMGSRLHFLGQVENPERVLAALDVLVIPSRTEGIPACLIEASLTGIPSVVTDVGGMAEVADRLRSGPVVPVDDHDAFLDAVQIVLDSRASFRPDRERTILDHGIQEVAVTWERVLLDAVRN